MKIKKVFSVKNIWTKKCDTVDSIMNIFVESLGLCKNVFAHQSNLDSIQQFFAENGIIKNDLVLKAMRGVDRKHYSSNSPYADSPQSIGKLFSF